MRQKENQESTVYQESGKEKVGEGMSHRQMLLICHLRWGLKFTSGFGNHMEVTSEVHRIHFDRIAEAKADCFTEKWKRELWRMITYKS